MNVTTKRTGLSGQIVTPPYRHISFVASRAPVPKRCC